MFRLRRNRFRPKRRPAMAQFDRVEALEARQLLAATTSLTWGGAPHSLRLTLENGSRLGPEGAELTINRSQFAGGLANLSGVILGPAPAFPPSHTSSGILELLFYVDGAVEPTATLGSFAGPTPSPEPGRA